MKVSMLDIAKELGISRATVSLALNNSPKVAVATRQSVLDAARRIGYKADPYVSALMAARRHGREPSDAPVLALVIPSREENSWKERYNLKRFIEGCQAYALELGFKTELFWIGDRAMTAMRLNQIICSRGIRGAVLISQGQWSPKLEYEWKDLAIVSFGGRELAPRSDWLSSDYYGNMEEALRILKSQGFSRIGFTMEKSFVFSRHNRWAAAYHMEQAEKELEPIDIWQDPSPTFEGFREWFVRNQPEAILSIEPYTVLKWVRQLGLQVPEDVSVAAITNVEEGGPVSGIVIDTETCGKLAIDMLLERIHRSESLPYATPRHVTVSGYWNRGETLKYR
ncbi:LacI family DNA-binding transcriptional regulator [Pelagicoccus enzymogenes]|uniref:LacI family DNA-binding transcriptional regulator n=1 Tax=Pelagicoccus enzymogenes TaxID=2773457 RepID=UPI0028123129|nr:LacI family DNA-binding transcriptional regulator [Pelagicoccus enzymogenes]